MAQNNYEIIYTEKFKKQIEQVFKYIVNELENKIAAENLVQLVQKEIIERSKSPENYKTFKLSNNGRYTWYRININNYSAFYTVENDKMTMRRFVYSKRNFNKLF